MNKKNNLLILWIIFGFVFVTAIDSILNLFTHLVYFVGSELGISYMILQYTIPLITLISYLLTTVIILKKIKTNSSSNGIYLIQFPKTQFIVFASIAVFVNPIINKLSGLYSVNNVSNLEENIIEVLSFYGWMISGIWVSRWLVLLVLIFVFLKKLNTNK